MKLLTGSYCPMICMQFKRDCIHISPFFANFNYGRYPLTIVFFYLKLTQIRKRNDAQYQADFVHYGYYYFFVCCGTKFIFLIRHTRGGLMKFHLKNTFF